MSGRRVIAVYTMSQAQPGRPIELSVAREDERTARDASGRVMAGTLLNEAWVALSVGDAATIVARLLLAIAETNGQPQ